MTTAAHVEPLRFNDMEEAAAALRARGLRLSTPRRMILEALFDAEGPVSAEYLAGRLDLDPASVYRNLETLEAHGAVQHVHLGHGPGLHALVGPGECEYLYCERCGAVSALAPSELEPVRVRIRERTGFDARFTHFPIVGTCAACAGARSGDSSGLHSHGDHVHAHPHDHPHDH